MHDLLSAVGACSSYTSGSRFRDTISNLSETTGRYPFPHSHPSVLFSADNSDDAHLHQVNHANEKSHMINGTTVQCTTSLALLSSSCQHERKRCLSQTELLRGDKVASASDFVEAVVTKHHDPLIQSYVWDFIGLCHRYQDKLTSTDRKKQISPVNLLYSAIVGFCHDTTRILYVHMERRRCDQSTLSEKLHQIHQEYRLGRGGGRDFVALVSDQSVFKMVFEMSHHSGAQV